MKIILFTDSLGFGGAQRQLVGLALLLKSHGYDVSVLTYHDIPHYKPLLDANEIENVVKHGNSSYLSILWEVFKYMKTLKPDIVIAYQSSPSFLLCLLRPILKIKKLIVSERNTTVKITIKDKILYKLWHFADYIVPNSYSQTLFIKQNVPQYSDKLVTITNYIDTTLFVPQKRVVEDSCELNILSIGRITPQKNILEYIRAIYIVHSNGYKIKVNWYGSTDNQEYDAQCRSLIIQYGLKDVFTVHPAQDDVVTLYQNADVFCLPSLYEGFPNVICEAMGCGLPVLCSDVCDNPLIVERNINGLLFSPQKAETIAETIIEYYNLPQNIKNSMGMASRELSMKKFTSETFVQKYIELIES